MLLVMINKDYYKNYDTELKNIMEKYKKERESMQCKNVKDKN